MNCGPAKGEVRSRSIVRFQQTVRQECIRRLAAADTIPDLEATQFSKEWAAWLAVGEARGTDVEWRPSWRHDIGSVHQWVGGCARRRPHLWIEHGQVESAGVQFRRARWLPDHGYLIPLSVPHRRAFNPKTRPTGRSMDPAVVDARVDVPSIWAREVRVC